MSNKILCCFIWGCLIISTCINLERLVLWLIKFIECFGSLGLLLGNLKGINGDEGCWNLSNFKREWLSWRREELGQQDFDCSRLIWGINVIGWYLGWEGKALGATFGGLSRTSFSGCQFSRRLDSLILVAIFEVLLLCAFSHTQAAFQLGFVVKALLLCFWC